MRAECSPTLPEFPPADSSRVAATFDGGAIRLDAGAMVLGAADWPMQLTERFTACSNDRRRAELVESHVGTPAQVRVRRINAAVASACPWQNEFVLVHSRSHDAAA